MKMFIIFNDKEQMKKIILMSAVALCATAVNAQKKAEVVVTKGHDMEEPWQGISRTIPLSEVIVPYGIDVTFEKTTHIIFPSPIRYVDLGSTNIIAGKADDAENVLRVKSAVRGFNTETNLSVICEDGTFYTFNVKYSDEPQKLGVEMDGLRARTRRTTSNNRTDVMFRELGMGKPAVAETVMEGIYRHKGNTSAHRSQKRFGVKFSLKGIYAYNGMLYFHTELKNATNMGYDVDFISFKVVDRKTARRSAMQERVVKPVRTTNDMAVIQPKTTERSVYAFEQFSLDDRKKLEICIHERNSGRTLTLYVGQRELAGAKGVEKLSSR